MLKIHTIEDAISNIRKEKKRNFNQSIEVHVRLNIDTTKSDQNISTYEILPKPTNFKRKIVVITNKDEKSFSFTSKPFLIGDEELIKEIVKKNKFNFDYIITEPSMMKILGKYGKQLGTKGLLPSPKKGTVGINLTDIYNNLVSQQVLLKNDKNGVIHYIVGKLSCPDKDIIQNYNKSLLTIKNNKNKNVKGDFIKSIFITSTMGKSYKLL